MIKFVKVGVAFAGLAVASMSPATAQVARVDPGLQTPAGSSLTEVQFRGRYHGRYMRRGGGGYYRRGGGGGVAAGIVGLAAGAIIGGAIASQARPAYGYGDPVAYCMSRFKSYDPASGSYLGYDGFRHPCP